MNLKRLMSRKKASAGGGKKSSSDDDGPSITPPPWIDLYPEKLRYRPGTRKPMHEMRIHMPGGAIKRIVFRHVGYHNEDEAPRWEPKTDPFAAYATKKRPDGDDED